MSLPGSGTAVGIILRAEHLAIFVTGELPTDFRDTHLGRIGRTRS